MSDNLQNDHVIIESPKPVDTTLPMVIYALYLASIITGGLTALVGVVIAYVYQGKGPEWLDRHYRYQIRTFWIGLLYFGHLHGHDRHRDWLAVAGRGAGLVGGALRQGHEISERETADAE